MSNTVGMPKHYRDFYRCKVIRVGCSVFCSKVEKKHEAFVIAVHTADVYRSLTQTVLRIEICARVKKDDESIQMPVCASEDDGGASAPIRGPQIEIHISNLMTRE